ncbi:MAG: hypothetical protein KKF44_01660 [Nanoarchaeota archaeon]|nr:hypothetical protein [Nanoarchaeota archaeon]
MGGVLEEKIATARARVAGYQLAENLPVELRTQPMFGTADTLDAVVTSFEQGFFQQLTAESEPHFKPEDLIWWYSAQPIDATDFEFPGAPWDDVVMIHPFNSQVEILHTLEYHDAPIPYLYDNNYIAFISDFVCPLSMLASDVISLSFEGLTVGTGVELYLTVASELELIYEGWNPTVHILADKEDELIKLLQDKVAFPELHEVMNFYDVTDADKQLMFDNIIEGKGHNKSFSINEGKKIMQRLILHLRILSLMSGKYFEETLDDGSVKRYYDLTGNGNPLSADVEPYVLFLYAHDALHKDPDIMDGFIDPDGDGLSMKFPDYQSRNDLFVNVPYSREQRLDAGYRVLQSIPGITDQNLDDYNFYMAAEEEKKAHGKTELYKALNGIHDKQYQKAVKHLGQGDSIDYTEFGQPTTSPSTYCRRFIPNDNIVSPKYFAELRQKIVNTPSPVQDSTRTLIEKYGRQLAELD